MRGGQYFKNRPACVSRSVTYVAASHTNGGYLRRFIARYLRIARFPAGSLCFRRTADDGRCTNRPPIIRIIRVVGYVFESTVVPPPFPPGHADESNTCACVSVSTRARPSLPRRRTINSRDTRLDNVTRADGRTYVFAAVPFVRRRRVSV